MRYLEFNQEKLERARAAYEFPSKVVILDKKNVSESDSVSSEADDAFSEHTGANENISEDNNSNQDANNSIKEPEIIKEVQKIEPEKPVGNNEKTDVYSKNSQTASPLTPQESYTLIESNTIEDIINKLAQDNKGSFTLGDFQIKLMLLPKQHSCYRNEDQAEQTLRQLLQQGGIREVEAGKYAPTTAAASSSSSPFF